MNGSLPAGSAGGPDLEATPSLREPQTYRGYTLQQSRTGIEIWWGTQLITISATWISAKKEVDDWLWAK